MISTGIVWVYEGYAAEENYQHKCDKCGMLDNYGQEWPVKNEYQPTRELVLKLLDEIEEDRKYVALVTEANDRMLRRMQAAFDERDELRAKVARLKKDRYDLLAATATDIHCSAAEWQMRTAKAEARVRELVRQLTKAKDTLRHIADRKESPSVTKLYLGEVAYTTIKKLDAEAAEAAKGTHEQR